MRRSNWIFPKSGCRSDGVKVDAAVLGGTALVQTQRPTWGSCGLIADSHREKLPADQEGDNSLQGAAEKMERSTQLVSPLHHTHTHTHTPLPLGSQKK